MVIDGYDGDNSRGGTNKKVQQNQMRSGNHSETKLKWENMGVWAVMKWIITMHVIYSQNAEPFYFSHFENNLKKRFVKTNYIM